jgi:hypothetical protein
MSGRTDVFLSYARGDDPKFAVRLAKDLSKSGFVVWFDKTSMPSRGLHFTQELRDAIENTTRLIAIVGPTALLSDYVRAEWGYATAICKTITPILRLGDYSLLPPELASFHCVDFRSGRSYPEANQELLRILREPVRRTATLFGVPALPPHYQARHEHIDRLRRTVLADTERPVVITSAQQTAGLQGMAGVGKSTIATAFARDCNTRRAFYDGVIWCPLTRHQDTISLLKTLAIAIGESPDEYSQLSSGHARLARALEARVSLIVLDDLWDLTQAVAVRDALGPRCRLLITTRDRTTVEHLGAEVHAVDVLEDDAAVQLLLEWAGQNDYADPEVVVAVAHECGNLPFALAQCGAMKRDGVAWRDILKALRDADVDFISMRLPNYPYKTLFRSLKVSVDYLQRSDSVAAYLTCSPKTAHA